MSDERLITAEYRDWLKAIKQRVRQAQLKAAVQVNTASTIWPQVVAILVQIPWGHNREIIIKCKKPRRGLR